MSVEETGSKLSVETTDAESSGPDWRVYPHPEKGKDLHDNPDERGRAGAGLAAPPRDYVRASAR